MPDTLTLTDLLARAQLLMLEEQIDPLSHTLERDTRELLYALTAYVPQIVATNNELCGIIHDLCHTIDHLTDRMQKGHDYAS